MGCINWLDKSTIISKNGIITFSPFLNEISFFKPSLFFSSVIPVHFLNGVETDYPRVPHFAPRVLAPCLPTETIHVAYTKRVLIPRANMAAFWT